MHLICSSWHRRGCCDPQQRVGKLYPSIWWTTRGTWILNARIFKHSFRISRPFFLCFLRIVFSFLCCFRLNSLCVPIPATEFVRVQIKWQQKWIMHFHRQQNQNKKTNQKKKIDPTKIEHLSTMVWIHSNDLVCLAVSLKQKSSNGETVYARPTEPAASRKRIA